MKFWIDRKIAPRLRVRPIPPSECPDVHVVEILEINGEPVETKTYFRMSKSMFLQMKKAFAKIPKD